MSWKWSRNNSFKQTKKVLSYTNLFHPRHSTSIKFQTQS